MLAVARLRSTLWCSLDIGPFAPSTLSRSTSSVLMSHHQSSCHIISPHVTSSVFMSHHQSSCLDRVLCPEAPSAHDQSTQFECRQACQAPTSVYCRCGVLSQTDRQTDTQTDKTDRQDRQTRQTDRQGKTDRQTRTDRQTNRQTDRQTDRQTSVSVELRLRGVARLACTTPLR